jgi:hypothetical protein
MNPEAFGVVIRRRGYPQWQQDVSFSYLSLTITWEHDDTSSADGCKLLRTNG